MNDVDVPEGMRFVGYYCEHPQPCGEDGKPDWSAQRTPHRTPWYGQKPKYKAERGWDETASTTQSLTFPDFREGDAERNCQYRVPVFVRETDLEQKA